jgi:hypothetical protein
MSGTGTPAGRHRLVMRYEPPEVREGLWLSGLGLVLLLALSGWELWARRRRQAPAPAAGRAGSPG